MRVPPIALVPLLASALALAPGCGGPPPASASKAEAKVSGTVKVRGKPATRGEVTFNPANIARKDAAPRTAPIQPDGTYQLITLAGGNRVSVVAPEVDDAALKSAPNLGTFLDVKEGASTIDLDVPFP